jgi:pilus assembly protein CpaB
MQRYRPIIFFGLAAVLALFTSLMVSSWLRNQARGMAEAAPPFGTVNVVVADADMAWGTKLVPEMLQVVRYPNEKLPEGHFLTVESLKDRVVLIDIKQNEVILESKLAPTSAVGGVSAVTQPSKRAMGVKVDEVIGVAGFIKPGDRVDVMVTLDQTVLNGRPTSKVILENIKVLAAGTQMVRAGKDEEAKPVQVMTLEVDIQEAEKLALASVQGKIRLALRNPLNVEPILTVGATVDSLLTSFRPKTEPKPVASANDPVEMIKGGEVVKSKPHKNAKS